jgi:hypothetical protein
MIDAIIIFASPFKNKSCVFWEILGNSVFPIFLRALCNFGHVVCSAGKTTLSTVCFSVGSEMANETDPRPEMSCIIVINAEIVDSVKKMVLVMVEFAKWSLLHRLMVLSLEIKGL